MMISIAIAAIYEMAVHYFNCFFMSLIRASLIVVSYICYMYYPCFCSDEIVP